MMQVATDGKKTCHYIIYLMLVTTVCKHVSALKKKYKTTHATNLL